MARVSRNYGSDGQICNLMTIRTEAKICILHRINVINKQNNLKTTQQENRIGVIRRFDKSWQHLWKQLEQALHYSKENFDWKNSKHNDR